MELKKYDLLALDGGVNTSAAATHIEDSEAQRLENFTLRDGSLHRRGGTRRLTTTPYGQKLTGLFAYKKAIGDWILVLGARQSLARKDGGGVVAIPHVNGTAYVDDVSPWCFRQYNDILYAVRKNVNRIQRFDGNVIMDAGIDKPVAAPTATEGAAGALPAATFRYVVTFASDRAESDFSPEASVTIAASKKVNLSNLPVSTNPQVQRKNIYRSLANASGEWFFLASIGNYITEYEDNILDEDLLDPVSVENGLPPTGIVFIEFWRERMFATDGRDLYLSRIGFPEQFRLGLVIQVSPDDGHEIRGLCDWGERLLIGKTNAMHYLVGTDITDFAKGTLSTKHGVASGHTMAAVKNFAFWLGLDDFYVSTGEEPQGFGSGKVRSFLKSIPEELKARAVSYTVPDQKLYVTSIPQDESGAFDRELAFNYEKGTWETYKRGSLGAPTFAGEFSDENFGRSQYACFDNGHVYQLNSGQTDDGEPIVAAVRSKEFGFEAHNVLKWIQKLGVLCSSVPEYLTSRIYVDGKATAAKERSIYLLQDRPWKRLGVSNARKLGATVSFELEYSGDDDFELSAVSFELCQTGRSTRPI